MNVLKVRSWKRMEHVIVCILDPRRPGSEMSTPFSTEGARATEQCHFGCWGDLEGAGLGPLLGATLTMRAGQHRVGASSLPPRFFWQCREAWFPQPECPEAPGPSELRVCYQQWCSLAFLPLNVKGQWWECGSVWLCAFVLHPEVAKPCLGENLNIYLWGLNIMS